MTKLQILNSSKPESTRRYMRFYSSETRHNNIGCQSLITWETIGLPSLATS